MMMHPILAAFFLSCSIVASADETTFRSVFHNARNEHKILNGAPLFETEVEDVAVEESDTLEVLCSATGDQPIIYKWFDPSESMIPSDTSKTIYTILSDDGAWLVISNVSLIHQGAYTCTASNKYGLATKFCNVIVKNKDPKNESDTNGSASIVRVTGDVSNNSISFKIYTNGNVETIYAQYSEIRSPSNYSTVQWKFGGTGPYVASNLIGAGKYSFQFKLSESDEWSKIYTFVLLPDIPQVIFRALSNDAVKIEWYKSIDNIMRDTIDKHELSYYTVSQVRGNYFVRNDCAVTIEIPKCSGYSYTITPLYKDTYYEIRLRAHTSEGYGEPFYFIIRP